MKQPELGRKITELRKSKGWTQEELVEKCNVSVRTIQRIESGEVTPRSYTTKTILAALGYDLDVSAVNGGAISIWSRLKSLVGIDIERPSDSLVRQLNAAW